MEEVKVSLSMGEWKELMGHVYSHDQPTNQGLDICDKIQMQLNIEEGFESEQVVFKVYRKNERD